MHERVNKSSSWTPTSSQKKSKNLHAKPSTSIQPKQENISSQQQEMPTYSTAAADWLAANIMRSLEPQEPESSETSTGKLQSETGQAAFPLIAAPIPSTPVVQSQEIGIQRQCSACAKEQSTEEGKDIDEISLAASGIQTKLTIGAPPNPYQQAANQMAEVMSKPILYAPMPQVQRFSPQESQIQLRAASAQSISPMMQMSVEQQAQMSALIQRTFRGEGTQASFEPVQAKLTVGEPGDKYEQEADAVARTVVEKINAPTTEPSVQRQSEVGGASELNITVMRHSNSGVSGGESVTVDVEQGIQQARGGGQGLDEWVRGPMEGAFGADFSGVRVHTDANSDVLNRSISARAFTTGQDIFFKQGEYNPGSRGGQELLAHELTHVVQQTGGVQTKLIQRQLVGRDMVQMMPRVKPGTLSLEEAKQALAIANKDLALELAQGAADVAGIFDPTPISDGISAAISLAKGDYVGAGLSLISMVPYVGDALGKPIKAARNGKKIIKLRKEIAALIARINELSAGAMKAAQKTKGSVSDGIKRVINEVEGKTTKKTGNTSNKVWKEGAYHGAKPKYENPGHHDPSSSNFRGGGSRTSTLPPDSEEVYCSVIPSLDGKTWWGRNAQGEIYRYQSHTDGKVHWNGRQNSDRGLQVPNYIRKRFESLDKDMRR